MAERSISHVLKKWSAKSKPLALEVEVALGRLSRDDPARNQLVEANIKFAHDIAQRYYQFLYRHHPYMQVAFDDLLSACYFGMIQARDTYDDRGAKFISHAKMPMIRQMLAEVSKNYTVTLPRNAMPEVRRVSKRLNLSGEISEEELEQLTTEISPLEKIFLRMFNSPNVISIEKVENQAEFEGYEQYDLIEALSEIEIEHAIASALSYLKPRSKKALELYYGIGTDEPLSLEIVGKIIDVSGGRVGQINDRSLAQLRTLAQVPFTPRAIITLQEHHGTQSYGRGRYHRRSEPKTFSFIEVNALTVTAPNGEKLFPSPETKKDLQIKVAKLRKVIKGVHGTNNWFHVWSEGEGVIKLQAQRPGIEKVVLSEEYLAQADRWDVERNYKRNESLMLIRDNKTGLSYLINSQPHAHF